MQSVKIYALILRRSIMVTTKYDWLFILDTWLRTYVKMRFIKATVKSFCMIF